MEKEERRKQSLREKAGEEQIGRVRAAAQGEQIPEKRLRLRAGHCQGCWPQTPQ